MPELDTEPGSITEKQMKFIGYLIGQRIRGPVCVEHARAGILTESEVHRFDGQPIDYVIEWFSANRASNVIDRLQSTSPQPPTAAA